MPVKKISVALVDSHLLFRRGFSNLVNTSNNNYEVLYEAASLEALSVILQKNIPDIVLFGFDGNIAGGCEMAWWLTDKYPGIKKIAMAIEQTEEAVMKILLAGADGYLCKASDPMEIRKALDAVVAKGYYSKHSIFSNYLSKRLSITNPVKK